MTLRDRFVCRREGHVPVLRITSYGWSGVVPDGQPTYLSACARCGRVVEFPLPDKDAA